jgi:lipoyl(octanoyl) transferase
MQAFTASRSLQTRDEVWLLCHQSVFTQGQAGKPEHIVDPGEIPVVQIDRGGQVTYHGPGQLVAYILIDVRRRGVGVRDLVENIENAIIDVLAEFDIDGQSDRKAPGVYVKGAKIAALGLRIRQGSSYHGLSLNVAMDLAAFERINPCGYQGMRVTQLSDLTTLTLQGSSLMTEIASRLSAALGRRLGYSNLIQAEADFSDDSNSK